MNNGKKLVVGVGVSDTTFDFDRRFRYTVPVNMLDRAKVGVRVTVPFGKGNRKRLGVILLVEWVSIEETAKFKQISSFADVNPVIDEEQLSLLFWLKDNTLCTYYEAFKTLIPPGQAVNFTEKYRLVRDIPNKALSSRAQELYGDLLNLRSDSEIASFIENAFDKDDNDDIIELVEKGYVQSYEEFRQRVKDETIKMIRLSDEYLESPNRFNVTPKQKIVCDVLLREQAASLKEIEYICGITGAVIKNMLKNGIVEQYEYKTIATPDVNSVVDPNAIKLNEEQQIAFDGIARLIAERKANAALLYGVTGSGKTLVFAKLIKYTLDMGRNVLLLLPEISLTPQAVNRFTALFGDIVSVVHSALPLSARLNEYKRAKTGQARIVIGTRSAVFAPLSNIGLIVVDEEGERTYKSESSPRYDAKAIAKQRCRTHDAVLLLASATPSIESYYMALSGSYKLFTMAHRYSKCGMPKVDIVDMTGTGRIFSEELVREVNANLERGEQSILLLNRRGYHTHITCMDCHEAMVCPNCSVPVTYHKANNRVMCHYCGYNEVMHGICSHCGSAKLRKNGMGTQRLEEELAEFFPNARIVRMDADTTYSRYAYDKRFTEFANGDYDIMIGTQMIAKGLDFPKVTLVGVLNADKSLFTGDFRNYERTFSLITQVVGRCGRGDNSGRAIIQTFVPDHYVINLAAMQDYDAFYKQEILMRKALLYPPFCDICVLGFSGATQKNVAVVARRFADEIKESQTLTDKKIPLRILGPASCDIERINGKYRYKIILKSRNNADFREFIGAIRKKLSKETNGVAVYIDINGEASL